MLHIIKIRGCLTFILPTQEALGRTQECAGTAEILTALSESTDS